METNHLSIDFKQQYGSSDKVETTISQGSRIGVDIVRPKFCGECIYSGIENCPAKLAAGKCACKPKAKLLRS